MNDNPYIATNQLVLLLRSFLTQIGIETREQVITETMFLPGLLIQNGILLIDSAQLLYPGDILHEAGHIAVSLSEDRHQLTGNVTEQRPDKAGDELAVLLWTYAACLHLNLDPHLVFHPAGYRGQSDWLIEQFTTESYIGLPLLVWMGLTLYPTANDQFGGFPKMTKWVRD
jgi:hypothetical protein